MIITKTPYRISFFGGGTDYSEWYRENGGAFLSTINKYIYLSVRSLPSFDGNNYRVVWSKVETTNKIKKIEHNVVREMLGHFRVKKGMEIHYQGDLPARSGMGSSSSFVVGLMNCFLNMKKNVVLKKNLAKKSIHFEKKILRETVGIQDQISAAYGGFNRVKISPKGEFVVKKFKNNQSISNLGKNLILIYTGINRTASDIAKKYVGNLKKRNMVLKEISTQVKEGENFLLNNKFDDFGLLLNEGWRLKKSIDKVISNKKIDELYDFAIKNGATGGKILGAGGGGFMLLYSPKDKISKLKRSLKNTTIIPFKFSDTGSEILLNTEK